jgi:CBS domain containing-hemolysin-like protein
METMDIIIIGKLITIMLLVLGNAFFVGSEIAITSARRSRIKQLADMGDKSAKTVQLLHNEPTRFYSVTQIGITLVSMALGAIGMTTIAQITDPAFESIFGVIGLTTEIAHIVSYALAFVIISFLHVVAGELAPKVLAFHKAEKMALALGGIVNWMYLAFRPVIWVMNHASNGLLWIAGQGDIIGGGDGHGHAAMSEEELRTIISASEQAKAIPKSTGRIIRGAFDLGSDKVRTVMVPRVDVKSLNEDDSVSDALKIFKETNHKRFPVYRDSPDNVVGVINIKSMLHALDTNTDDALKTLQAPVKTIMRKPFMIPATSQVSDLLTQFKRERRQIAIAVNEYGSMTGVITLEDILSDLIGEVQDEFTPHSRKVKKLTGSQWSIEAAMRVDALEAIVNYPFPLSEEYTTLGGMLYTRLGKIPSEGDVLELEGCRLQVEEMAGHRIMRIKFIDTQIDEDGQVREIESAEPDEDDDDIIH